MWPCLYKTRAKISGRSTSKQHLNLRSTAHTHQCILSLKTSTVLLSITLYSQRRTHAHSQVTRVVKHSHTNHVNQCKTLTALVVHSVSGTLQQRTLTWMPFQTWALNGFMALGEKSPHLTFSTYQISNHQFAQDKLWEIHGKLQVAVEAFTASKGVSAGSKLSMTDMESSSAPWKQNKRVCHMTAVRTFKLQANGRVLSEKQGRRRATPQTGAPQLRGQLPDFDLSSLRPP